MVGLLILLKLRMFLRVQFRSKCYVTELREFFVANIFVRNAMGLSVPEWFVVTFVFVSMPSNIRTFSLK